MKLILIGFMGVGKTSVGKKLSEKLNLKVIDTDYEIEKSENKTISQIFEDYGERYFRTLETKISKSSIKEEKTNNYKN